MGAEGVQKEETMVDRRVEEARVCRVHGTVMEARAGALHCPGCERMGGHGQIIIAACPHPKCGATLLGIEPLIKGQPSIKLGWRYTREELRDGKNHELYVSSQWGDHTSFPGLGDTVAEGEVLDLFCPVCGQEFPTVAYCDCRAKMVFIRGRYMNGGQDGFIEVCARRGCPEHRKGRPDERRAVSMAAAGLQSMCGAPEPDELVRGTSGTM